MTAVGNMYDNDYFKGIAIGFAAICFGLNDSPIRLDSVGISCF
jgi:hypothetical protein